MKHIESISESSDPESLQATPKMCHFCFVMLIWHLTGETIVPIDDINPFTDYPEDTMCPLFVTWEVYDCHQYKLRGCIGTLQPKPLTTALGEYAVTSATKDGRFSPVTIPELSELRVAVSLLVNYETCADCYDWEVGAHGIMISWRDAENLRTYSATYLPEVALEQQWSQVTAVESLIRKAGYTGSVNDALLQGIQCTRYQSSKCRVSYDQFVASLEPEWLQALKRATVSRSNSGKNDDDKPCHIM